MIKISFLCSLYNSKIQVLVCKVIYEMFHFFIELRI